MFGVGLGSLGRWLGGLGFGVLLIGFIGLRVWRGWGLGCWVSGWDLGTRATD